MIQSTFVENFNRLSLNDYSKHINWMLRIQDDDLRKDFYSFSKTQRSFVFILVFAFILTFIYTPLELNVIKNIFQIKRNTLYFCFPLLSTFNLTIANISTWFYVIAHMYSSSFIKKFDKLNSTIFIISVTIMAIFRIFRYSAMSCELDLLSDIIIGRECEDKHILSWDTDTRFWLSCLSYISILITIITLSIRYHPRYSGLMIIWGPLIFFLLKEVYLQRVRNYFLNRRIVETLINNENNQAENQANEMRHMIANVAHDLKTPLSSFISGVEIIEQVLYECEDNHRDGSLTLDSCYDKFHSIGQYLEDIRNTNSFMLMTINRCIDYTKASKGMKLIPKYETIDLYETLTLPLNCMRNIQSRISIVLQPISKDICSHVITDKQWLQENILCLLSNAVKYSSGGEVTISISIDSYDLKHSMNTNEMKLKLIDPSKSDQNRSANLSSSSSSSPDDDGSASKRKIILRSSLSSISDNIREMFQLNSSTKSSRVSPLNSKSNVSTISTIAFNGSIRSEKLPTTFENDPCSSENIEDPCIPYLLFEIEDTGIGMSDEAMGSLFNPFKQNQRLAGGTGLGLYSLAKRVEALNGLYGVKKRHDKKEGSLFWFAIPYKPDEITATQVLSSAGHSLKISQKDESFTYFTNLNTLPFRSPNLNIVIKNDSISQPSSPKTQDSVSFSLKTPRAAYMKVKQSGLNILLVDDSPTILKMTTLMLRKYGHHIETAENGAIAVQMVENLWNEKALIYDLVLMDLQMPVMDGLEATRRIRINESKEKEYLSRPKQIIFGCSANSDAETTEEAMNAGLNHFMSKHFTIDSFQETIAKFIPVGGVNPYHHYDI